MHGLVLLDPHGDVLRPAILWNDQRTGAECAAMTERIGAERLLALTGNPVLPGFTAPKLLWVRTHEPAVFARASALLLPKDWIRYRLTGERICDVSDASGTSLLDVEHRRWSDEVVSALDIPPSWLPTLVESPDVSAHVSEWAAALTGLPRARRWWAAPGTRPPRPSDRASSTRGSSRSPSAHRASSSPRRTATGGTPGAVSTRSATRPPASGT